MLELLRTSDPVLVSFVEALLREQRIDYHVADLNTSAVEGSIGVFPRRVLVVEAALDVARALLVDAGLGSELPDESRRGKPPTGPSRPA
ncbi:MAG: DUF2007 domain-containing protein [Hyphomicrobiaceae bacterium]